MPAKLVESNRLTKFVEAVLKAYGAMPEAARITADALVAADLRGNSTHGVSRLKRMIAGIKAGNCAPGAKPEIVSEKNASIVLDGRKGLGHAVALEAMKLALKKAREHGVGVVAVRNSNHFGIAGYYSEFAAKQGFVGIALCNAEPAVSAFDGKKKFLGTNPIAIAFPSGEGVVSIDMATTGITRGALLEASRKKEKIPEGMALDAEGNPTTDPDKALAGRLLPLGGLEKGYKGVALAFAVDVLSGALSGACCGGKTRGTTNTENPCTKGDFMMAIDVASFVPVEKFKQQVTELVNELKESGQGEAVFYPGEKEARETLERKRNGIPLDEDMLETLKKIGSECGVEFVPS